MILSRSQKVVSFLIVCLLVAGVTYYVCVSGKPRDLNVVLITIDALRADHLGCYGYKRDTSPNIDALSREGTLFTQAIAQAPQTPPSMGVITTSTYPPVNLLRGWGETLRPGIPTLAEILKARGYKTIFASSHTGLSTLHGFEKGFDEFYAAPAIRSRLAQITLDLVQNVRSKPFFLWIHYMNAHDFTPGKKFENFFTNDKFYNSQNKLPITLRGPGGIPQPLARKLGNSENLDYYVALYDGAIRAIDEQIGLLLRTLKQTYGDRNTLVIISADHGELFGEHGYYLFHGSFLYEPLLKVPFILYCPGLAPPKRVDAQISAGLDVLPTILGALKIRGPATVKGVNLLSILGKEQVLPSYVMSDEGHRRRSVRTSEWKMVYTPQIGRSPASYELFQLKNDPDEMHNLIFEEKDVSANLREKLTAYGGQFPDIKAPVSSLNADDRKGLRGLGYLQ